jgi:hypothetical protein
MRKPSCPSRRETSDHRQHFRRTRCDCRFPE